MKRLALVLAVVAMGACKKAEQQPAQGQMSSDTSHMMMSDTSKMMSDSGHSVGGVVSTTLTVKAALTVL